MTKEEAILQLENLKEHCNEMSKSNILWESDVIALDIAIKELKKGEGKTLKNDRNEMIVNDIKNIIKRYDDMNLTISHEERRDNNVKAYMEIKDYFNTAEDKKE